MDEVIQSVALIGRGTDWLWSMLQFATVVITLPLIYRQFRLQSASHLVATLVAIEARWNEERMLRVRHEFCSSWLAGNREYDAVGDHIAEFFVDLGSYRRLHIPSSVLWNSHSWNVEHYYQLLEKGLNETRAECSDDTLYVEFKTLFDDMKRISKRKGAPGYPRSDALLEAFVLEEERRTEVLLRLRAQKG